MMKEKVPYSVCCPECGRLMQKSVMTESEIRCPKCGHRWFAIVDKDVVTIIEHDTKGLDITYIDKLQTYACK